MKYLPKSKWKKAGWLLLLTFGLIQFIPKPERNISAAITKNSIEKIYPIPDTALTILKAACYDCHSNNTSYPWYSNIQPAAWFLNKHIIEGKTELNFDEFGTYSKRRQQSKLKAIVNQVKDGEMPLTSYKILHNAARLSENEANQIINWTNTLLEK
jgi:hypothetical protein